ncbi:DUF4175 domain-containing protein [Sphingomonas sp.]|jgi:hypothetical protein|uniref:DUF4175 domain-containing protein n=1 Tax=Sphingomonas sp. TaxID=28214 RepID=UPI002EDB6D73
MTAPERFIAPARTRAAADTAAISAPLAIAAVVAAWRFGGTIAAILVVVATLAIVATIAHVRTRGYDARWLVRGFDARRSDMEDSADLLFATDAPLTALQQLQRARLLERLAADAGPDLRPAWSRRAILLAWIAGALAAVALLSPFTKSPPALSPSAEGLPAAPGIPRLTGQALRITPPAYTGLPPRDVTTLDARAPEGSRIAWTLSFAPAPDAAALAFHDGGRVAMARGGATWRTSIVLARSALYRVVPRGTDRLPPLHRLDAIADRPPRITTALPTLALVAAGQRMWAPAFAATDDYGVAVRGSLRITLAQGEGENVTFRERMMPIDGTGAPRARRFAPRLDLAGVGFGGVGDLIVQLTVADARGHAVRGPSLILRRAAPTAEAGTGLDGAVKKALPAYFRSQRQIIIDAEALIRRRRTLAPDDFVSRSDTIGIDQRLLRMRYGQFLGEEAEGPSVALPTSDTEKAEAHTPDDGHDHATEPSPTLGRDTDVLADFGHTHDEPEAATLLDPGTRATLRQALDQMWQSELHLRQGDPAGALPFANRALVFIKRVQQATRIYLARTGSAQPAIEEARRMTGKREGLAVGTLALTPPTPDGPEPATTWRALASPGPVGLDALDRWLRGGGRVPDRLALAAAIDAVRRDPGCGSCRAALRAALWTALPRPVPRVARREGGDAQGRRYLDAIAR